MIREVAERAFIAALNQSSDLTSFSHWTAERVEQYTGRKENGGNWFYIDGAVNIQQAASFFRAAVEEAGYKIVPVVPTEGMIEAGEKDLRPKNCYTAMLGAVEVE